MRQFSKSKRKQLRKEPGYASSEKIILFIGNAATKNPTKGFENLLKLLKCLAKHSQNMQITFLVLGDTFEDQFFGEKYKIKKHGMDTR